MNPYARKRVEKSFGYRALSAIVLDIFRIELEFIALFGYGNKSYT